MKIDRYVLLGVIIGIVFTLIAMRLVPHKSTEASVSSVPIATFEEALKACAEQGLELPTSQQLYFASRIGNQDVLFDQEWVRDTSSFEPDARYYVDWQTGNTHFTQDMERELFYQCMRPATPPSVPAY